MMIMNKEKSLTGNILHPGGRSFIILCLVVGEEIGIKYARDIMGNLLL